MPDGDWFTDDLDLRDLRAALVAERAEVAKLRAVIAKPTEEEARRLATLAALTYARERYYPWQHVIGAILADQRRRAG